MFTHAGLPRLFRRARWRVALTLLCLAAFAFNGVVASAHLHVARSSACKQCVGSVGGDRPARNTEPDDGSRCPLCQFLLAGGAALIPSHLPICVDSTRSFRLSGNHPALVVVTAISFAWRSRGPPLS